MRLLAVVILSIVTAVPAVAHRRKHIRIPLPQERIVNDVNSIHCANDTSSCGMAVGNTTRITSNSVDNSSASIWNMSEDKGPVPTKYTEEDISTLLRENYHPMTGWDDHTVGMVKEPVDRVPVSYYTAVDHTVSTPNRRVSFSLDTIIPILLIPCQALFAMILWFFIKPRYKRDDYYHWIYNDRFQRRRTWRRKCVNLVGLITCLVRQQLRRGMRTSRRLTTSFRERLLHWQRMMKEPLIS